MIVDLKVIMILIKLLNLYVNIEILWCYVWFVILDFVFVDFLWYLFLEGLIFGKREVFMYLIS